MARQTNADNIRDAISNLGGTPKSGRPTTADLLDQLEKLLSAGGASPAEVRQIVSELLPEALDGALDEKVRPIVEDAVEKLDGEGRLSPTDYDDIFGH